MKQLAKLFSAQFKMTFREKQVWFWSIFYPVLLLVVFLTFFGGMGDDGSFKAKIAVVADKETAVSTQLQTAMKQIDLLEWKSDSPVSREQAEDWVKEKDIDAAIVLPDSADAKQITLLVNKEKQANTTVQALNGILNEVLHQMNYAQANITPQLKLGIESISEGDDRLEYTDFLLTGMIALAISQAGLFGMVSMIEMRRNGLLKRLMMTPVSMGLFGLGGVLVRLFLSAIQVVLLALIGVLFYGANLHLDLLNFVLIFVVGTLAFAAIGFVIAAFSKSMDAYFGIANLLSFLMMFMSGIFFDTGSLPEWIKPVSAALPLTFFADGIRDAMVYDRTVLTSQFWLNAGVLAGWAVVAFIVGSRFYSWKAEKR
ncbi:ABC transporter permease [Paenibacillus koleovorans]|uniref:ABC transporter permease n=1 Tax=Paenibacillus koleovorans TaxID=121608 RepID=UPI000FD7B966|nr:ABC transporter permease [Paenibacillus koleovorans]